MKIFKVSGIVFGYFFGSIFELLLFLISSSKKIADYSLPFKATPMYYIIIGLGFAICISLADYLVYSYLKEKHKIISKFFILHLIAAWLGMIIFVIAGITINK